MTFNELVESYDPIDLLYRQCFSPDEDEMYLVQLRELRRKRIGSFIPDEEEVDEILLSPIRRMKENMNDCRV